jgi:diaminohydroxyphosphoribosylaminopyrimidine deaminase/5-amino-6-(5-phosphoribosylamino)uracil reductase
VRECIIATDQESQVQREALELNRRFITWQQQKRPYIILKWAETADGFIAPAPAGPYWISNAHARRLVHQWRSQEAAIWVGKTTVRRDNPQLNVRYWTGPNPLRLIIDPQLQLNPQLRIFDQSQPTLCYNTQKTETYQNLEFAQISENSSSWKERVRFVLDDLHTRQIQSVLVEGGATLLSFLISQGWWDEARVFQAPVNFEKGLPAPHLGDQYRNSQQRVSDNTLTVYRKNQKLNKK